MPINSSKEKQDRAYTTHTTCRVCGSSDLTFLYNIGKHYVNDFLLPSEDPGVKVPIELDLCNCCGLVQAKHTAPQNFLYTRHYWYKSGVTQMMRDALRDVTSTIENMGILNPSDIVLDIGANDGTLLHSYMYDDLVRVGVEPAKNLADQCFLAADIFIEDFWSAEGYWLRTDKKAKVITALGMFYDLEDPNQFIADVAEVLHEDGVFIAQLMCLKNMMDLKDIGNFAHEHLEFYSLKSLEYLLDLHDLQLYRIETNSVNGQSYRLFIRHNRSNFPKITSDDRKTIANAYEAEEGLDYPTPHHLFIQQLRDNRRDVVSYIRGLYDAGKSIWIYGASTKGNTILQFYGLDAMMIDGAADKSPEKCGRIMVGTGIPIFSEEEARKVKPDYFLVLPYAFIDEFIEREREFLSRGGHFIVPLPELKII